VKPRRADRVAEQVRQEIAILLLHESKDPGVAGVVVTRVRLSDDLGTARVAFVQEDPARDKDETLRALARAAPFLRSRLRERLALRRTPMLTFHWDDVLTEERRVGDLLAEISREGKS